MIRHAEILLVIEVEQPFALAGSSILRFRANRESKTR